MRGLAVNDLGTRLFLFDLKCKIFSFGSHKFSMYTFIEICGELMESRFIFVIGCAGGKVTLASLPYTMEKAAEGQIFHRVSFSNLKGGHSGMEIALGEV